MRYYIAPRFCRWEDLDLYDPLGRKVPMMSPGGSPGCMLVFESIEAMLESYPNADVESALSFEVPDEDD